MQYITLFLYTYINIRSEVECRVAVYITYSNIIIHIEFVCVCMIYAMLVFVTTIVLYLSIYMCVYIYV